MANKHNSECNCGECNCKSNDEFKNDLLQAYNNLAEAALLINKYNIYYGQALNIFNETMFKDMGLSTESILNYLHQKQNKSNFVPQEVTEEVLTEVDKILAKMKKTKNDDQ